jgi:N-acetylglucosamine malate deacetylase 2
MKILYIYAHPDDETFAAGLAIPAQKRLGHKVHLLTLTKGGATKVRHSLGLTVEQMGEVRYREMQQVQQVLELDGMTVLDLPDSGLKEMDPRVIEQEVRKEIERVRPDIVVTDVVYGVSGFHDHLVTHAVVKRVFLQMRDEGADYLKRLAFAVITEEEVEQVRQMGGFNLQASPPELIDCIMPVTKEDHDTMRRSLACYLTYLEVIKKSGIERVYGDQMYFEIFQENHKPPLLDLAESLPG